MIDLPRAAAIIAHHAAALEGRRETHPAALWQAISDNHRYNSLLWDEEDLARRRNAPDAEIAANKRAIDGHNQKRNDAIERIDEALVAALADAPRLRDARLSSETAGSMIDRLSILSLKIHHMRLQTERGDVERPHIEACQARLERLIEQCGDLAACLDRLLAECRAGSSVFKVYRQFKMYNDPALNPAVYNESRRPSRS